MLPPSARLIDDPWGAEWTGFGRLRRLAQAMPAAAQWLSRPAWRWLIYMQVRTFALDQEVVRFAQAGGRQLVLLGAGLDARALRLRRLGLRVFEVDHPATQARKRELLGDAATFVAWDFEDDPLRLLPGRLCDLGYRRAERGCVVMVAALHNWLSARASWRLFGRSKSEDAPKVGAYPVDYSEPTQEEIDAANGSCKELFKTGH
jgi:methyltransferase (TIGR00027 family)